MRNNCSVREGKPKERLRFDMKLVKRDEGYLPTNIQETILEAHSSAGREKNAFQGPSRRKTRKEF